MHGGAPWGASTVAAADGSRQPLPEELELAEFQGKVGWQSLTLVVLRHTYSIPKRAPCARLCGWQCSIRPLALRCAGGSAPTADRSVGSLLAR